MAAGLRKMLSVERARAALAACVEVDEVREIRDRAIAMQAYLRTQQAASALQQDAAELRLRAERRLGELTLKLPKRNGGQAAKARAKRLHNAVQLEIPPTLAERGITKREASKWQTLAAIPEKKFETYVAEARKKGERITATTPVALHRLDEKARKARALRRKPVPAPQGRFDVLVADPAWMFDKRAGDVTHRGQTEYPQMTVEEICELPVSRLAERDAILWLWVTNAHLVGPEMAAHRVLEAWGFEGRTMLTWHKNKMGNGDWLRGRTEHAIMAIRGSPVVQLTNQTTVFEAPVREHSRKPEEFYRIVDKLCPGSKLELFARTPRRGWQAWGNEVEKFVAAS